MVRQGMDARNSKNIKLLVASLGLVLSSCAEQPHPVQAKSAQRNNVLASTYGPIDRKTQDHKEVWKSELRFIGKLTTPTNDLCTASLISKNIIVTAAHCLVDPKEYQEDGANKFSKGEFSFELPARRAHQSLKSRIIGQGHWGTLNRDNSPESMAKDWALLELETPLGEGGHFQLSDKLQFRHEHLLEQDLKIAGFSRKFSDLGELSLQDKCNIHLFKGNQIEHDCEAWFGDSGAPLYYCDEDTEQCFIVGIHINSRIKTKEYESYSTDNTNIGIFFGAFFERFKEIE
ncbi:trypsin-like serine protease [bacterium]|nr:trypsin-like serine protease [bacterium]